jgi:hypothetical protein
MMFSTALLNNMLSPMVLAFWLGVGATLLRTNFRVPQPVYTALSIYLLFAIGIKGGGELRHAGLLAIVLPVLATLALGLITPLTAYAVARRFVQLDRPNAGALAAHYGSVSAVTFLAAQQFCRSLRVPCEGFMPSLIALLEVPAIIVALALVQIREGRDSSLRDVIHEVVTGPSVLLMVSGILIGYIAGPERLKPVEPFFVSGFPGALVLFLFELGMVAAEELPVMLRHGLKLGLFAVLVPLFHGVLGVAFGKVAGLSEGGCGVLGTMAASASYIAAPAAVRIALPEC